MTLCVAPDAKRSPGKGLVLYNGGMSASLPLPDPSAAWRPPAATSFRLLTEDERQASMKHALAQRPAGEVWVYGYGSLIWRPEFDFAERRPALLYGYHRALCLWSRVNRGTPEQPGLVFGLDAGGSCRGVAFRIAGADVPDIMDALWRREMPSGAYTPRWLRCSTQQGELHALVFSMNRNTDAYAPRLPLPVIRDVVERAHGRYGPCREYVLETAAALRRCNIHDRRLAEVVRALETPSNEA